MTDLAAYGPLAERLAGLGAEDDATLTFADFPDWQQTRATRGVVIDTNYTRHLGWAGDGERPFEITDRTDGFCVYALDPTYRQLGLWLIHLVLSGGGWAGLALPHPKSRAAWLYAEVLEPVGHVFGLQAEPRRYTG